MAKPRPALYMQISGLVVMAASVGVLCISSIFNIEYDTTVTSETMSESLIPTTTPKVAAVSSIIPTHKTPSPVKSIYMSQCVVGTRNFRDKLVKTY